MLARFGYDCPATGFAFEVGRVLLAIESQGAAAPAPGPDFFIIDFTADKTRALALSRRLRDLGAAVARDILSRGLDESLAYARQQRARWALVIGEPGADAEQVRVIPLDGKGGERRAAAAEILADPARHFPDMGGTRHA
jgi:ATP phosphoribosyltransferase regulatory subunit